MKLIRILSDRVQIRSDYKEFDDVRINDLISEIGRASCRERV